MSGKEADALRRSGVPAHPWEGPDAGARVTELDGPGWSVREALGETWRWYVDAAPPQAGNNVAEQADELAKAPGWRPAIVPGSVVDALVRAGEIAEPRHARDSRAAEWVADRSWVFRRPVVLQPNRPGETVVLELDGVDPGGTVFWDGQEVGCISGLYRRGRIDVTEWAEAGPHMLAVVVPPAPASEPQVGRTDRVRVHAPRMGYGWDFCPRLRHQGIWKSARLVTSRAHIASLTATSGLDSAGAHGTVDARVVTDAVHSAPLRLRGELLLRGTVVASSEAVAGHGMTRLRLDVERPRVWWPNGVGDQPLYDLRLTLTAGAPGDAAAPLAVATRRVGFRHVEWLPNEGAPPAALPYTVHVNGVAMPAIGWNWVPADALYGSAPEARVRHLVELAASSGARLLRVWGGGLIETDAFYDACDEYGLLVWQEFSQSSSGMQSAPATDAEFIAYLRAEAEAIVPTLTHHPCLALWGGGNELDEGGMPLTDDRSPALAALSEVVRRRDPGRAWVPTSPTGPEFHNRLDRIRSNPDGQHDVHGPWEHQGLERHHELYNAGTSLAHTEFGVEGMTNLRTLEALIPEPDRWPADRTNATYRHLGEWWNNADLLQRVFGGRLHDLEVMQHASQWLQATGLQYAVEADRRRWPRCSMVLPWQLNESFPNAWCTSSVDFRGDTKPAFDAVRRAFLPRRTTIRVDRSAWHEHDTFEAEGWAWSESRVSPGSAVSMRLRGLDGTVYAEAEATLGAVSDPAPAVRLEVPRAAVPLESAVGAAASSRSASILLWESEWRDADGTTIDTERMLLTASADFGGLLEVQRARMQVEVLADGADADLFAVRLRHIAGPAAIAVRLVDGRGIGSPGWAVVDGDPRPILPGEERVLRVRWSPDSDATSGTDGSAHGRVLRLDGWNVEMVHPASHANDTKARNEKGMTIR
jgi:beta-mannosidase